jgi:hypothetical protein
VEGQRHCSGAYAALFQGRREARKLNALTCAAVLTPERPHCGKTAAVDTITNNFQEIITRERKTGKSFFHGLPV